MLRQLVLLYALPVVLLCSANRGAGQDGASRITKSHQIMGVQLSVSTILKFKAGHPVPLEVELSNTGKQKAFVAMTKGGLPEIDIDVKDKNGQTVALTAYGKKYLRPSRIIDRLNSSVGSAAIVDLHFGETMNLSVSSISLFYDLTLPGEYNVTAQRSVGVAEGNSRKTIRLSAKVRMTIEHP